MELYGVIERSQINILPPCRHGIVSHSIFRSVSTLVAPSHVQTYLISKLWLAEVPDSMRGRLSHSRVIVNARCQRGVQRGHVTPNCTICVTAGLSLQLDPLLE